jgi:hypothetical protein
MITQFQGSTRALKSGIDRLNAAVTHLGNFEVVFASILGIKDVSSGVENFSSKFREINICCSTTFGEESK